MVHKAIVISSEIITLGYILLSQFYILFFNQFAILNLGNAHILVGRTDYLNR